MMTILTGSGSDGMIHFKGLELTRASTAGTFERMQTLVAVVITWVFFGQALAWHQVIAAVVLIAAVALVQRAQAQTARPDHEAVALAGTGASQAWPRTGAGRASVPVAVGSPLARQRTARQTDPPRLGVERVGLGLALERLDPGEERVGVLGLEVFGEPLDDRQQALACRQLLGAGLNDHVAQPRDVGPVWPRHRRRGPTGALTASDDAEAGEEVRDPLHARALCTRAILASIASGFVPVVARFGHGLRRR